MADDTPTPPANSMAGSAAFFDQDSPDLSERIADAERRVRLSEDPDFARNDFTIFPEVFEGAFPTDVEVTSDSEPPRLAYTKDPTGLPGRSIGGDEREVFTPLAPARTTSVRGPSLHSPLGAIDIGDNRPSATIVMKRTLRPGRQRWTWWLRENSTGTKMCFGRFYANYDEAVEYAHKCTSGYRVQANVVGDKPKGR